MFSCCKPHTSTTQRQANSLKMNLTEAVCYYFRLNSRATKKKKLATKQSWKHSRLVPKTLPANSTIRPGSTKAQTFSFSSLKGFLILLEAFVSTTAPGVGTKGFKAAEEIFLLVRNTPAEILVPLCSSWMSLLTRSLRFHVTLLLVSQTKFPLYINEIRRGWNNTKAGSRALPRVQAKRKRVWSRNHQLAPLPTRKQKKYF